MQNCKRCDKLLDDEVERCPACGASLGRKRSVWGNLLTPSASKPDVPPNDTTVPSFRQEGQSPRPAPYQGYVQPRPVQSKPADPVKKAFATAMVLLGLVMFGIFLVFRALTESERVSYVPSSYDWEEYEGYYYETKSDEYYENESYRNRCLPVSSSELRDIPEFYRDLPISVEGLVAQGTLYFAGEEFMGEPVESAIRFFELAEVDAATGEHKVVIAATLPFDAEILPFYGEEAVFYGEYIGLYVTETGEELPLVEARLCQRADTLLE